MEQADVVVVGGGPVGLALAGELALAGVRPVVLERLAEQNPVPKANGLVGQVVRWLDHRGLYQRLTGDQAPPRPAPAYMFGGLPLQLGLWDDNPLFTLPLPQWDLEAGLGAWAGESGVDIRRGCQVTGFTQDDAGVTVDHTGPAGTGQLRARYVVGCDGGRSDIRKHAGIDFAGVSSERLTSQVAHVELGEAINAAGMLVLPGLAPLAPFTYHRTGHGVFVFARFQGSVPLVTFLEWDLPPGTVGGDDTPVTLDDLRAAARRVLGADLTMSLPATPGRWVLRRIEARNTRQADRYRAGRVFLAGDAAHVHSAAGGPGLNLGLLDAANLAWKLAAAVHGWAPAGLLDSYHDERHPAGQRVVTQSQAQSALLAPGAEVTALRSLMTEFLAVPDNARRIAGIVSGGDTRYPCAGDTGHPLAGRWVPDFPLTVHGQATRLAELARTARPLLLDFTGGDTLAPVAAVWPDRIDRIAGQSDKPPAAALLIRPDGHAAWIADTEPAARPASLRAALGRWFGDPATP